MNGPINANRVVTDAAIREGRVNDAYAAAIRHIQLVKEAATRRNQELASQAKTTSASVIVDMNMDANGQPSVVFDNSSAIPAGEASP